MKAQVSILFNRIVFRYLRRYGLLKAGFVFETQERVVIKHYGVLDGPAMSVLRGLRYRTYFGNLIRVKTTRNVTLQDDIFIYQVTHKLLDIFVKERYIRMEKYKFDNKQMAFNNYWERRLKAEKTIAKTKRDIKYVNIFIKQIKELQNG